MSSRKNGVRKVDAEVSAQAKQELAEVYGAIMARNPEHDFDPTLDRVRDVCDLLGNPQNAYRSIHITGTNGKTSTARMIESLVGQYGLRTGRFTSPHMSSVTERISIDGESISPQRFVEVYRDVQPYIDMVDAKSKEQGLPCLSFFEVLTVMAYAAFADAPIDVAIIEVGMGGSWDSTNVIDADIAVITPISIDHQAWLGDTVRDIAIEKSGIIKQDKIAITSVQDDEALDVLIDSASSKQARLIIEGTDIEVASRLPAVGGQLIGLRTGAALYDEIYLPLFGEHQAHNALLALTAVEMLITGGGALAPELVEQGFAGVTSPGRLEVVRSSPTIIVDAAHNAAGIQALTKTIDEEFDFGRLIGVVGILDDKDAETILSYLEPILAEVIVTQSSSVRSVDVAELKAHAVEIFGEDRVFAADGLDDAIDIAATRAESEDDIGVGTGTGVLVTGSVILVAEARRLLGRG